MMKSSLRVARPALAGAVAVVLSVLQVSADGTPQTLPFAQSWTDIGLITVGDNWSGVPGVEGFRGDALTAAMDVDPQTVLAADDPGVLDVNANQTAPNTFLTGGVAEFHLANPVVALAGSGTADAPYVRLALNTMNFTNVVVSYNLRDLEDGADHAAQQVAMHFRVGNSGPFTNVPAAYVADATDGPNVGGRVTPVSATLPAAAENQPLVQVRIMTTNANGNDEWVGVDDLQVTGTPLGTLTLSVSDVTVTEGDLDTVAATFTVSLSAPAPADVTFDVASQDGSATVAGNDYMALDRAGQVIPAGEQSASFDVTVNGDAVMEPSETFFLNVTNVVGATVVDAQGQGTIVNDDTVPIHAIQGPGTASPLAGTAVTTRGIVTGVKTNGFFIQSAEVETDGDPDTSEGLFVFTGGPPPAAAASGNEVRVSGVVAEFRPPSDPASPPLTELTSPVVTLLRPGQPLPAAVALTAADTSPGGSIEQLERLEGMRVSVASLSVVAPTGRAFVDENDAVSVSNGVFYGVITGLARPFREPGIQAPTPPPPGSPCCIPTFDGNPERLRVDSDGQVGVSAIEVTTGATVTGLAGPLDFAFRTYTLLPDPGAEAAGNGSAVPVPAPAADEFTVASWNLERFYNDVDDPGLGEPVLNPAAFANRLNKASLAIRNVLRTPDILTVIEVENLPTLQALAAKVNADAVANGDLNPLYEAHLTEGNDPGGIDVGFLLKGAGRVVIFSMTQVGASATFINPNDGLPETLFDRPPLVLQAAVEVPPAPSTPVTVIANHLRSLIDVDSEVPQGTGTVGARVRAKRRAQAEFMASYIQGRQAANPFERIVSVGDYNAFEFNDGYVDSAGTIVGAPTPSDNVVLASPDLVNPNLASILPTLLPAQRYSFSFDGNAQVLDHALLSQAALPQFSRAAHARVGADFPESFRNTAGRPERLSDHDAPVVYFFRGEASLSIGNATAMEGQTATLTVTLSRPSAGPVTVAYATADGTAVAGSDYAAASGTLTFAPGQTATTINVVLPDDSVFEGTETFTVTLSGPVGAEILVGTGGVIIMDNEPVPAIFIDDLSAAEGSSGTTPFGFTLTLTNPSQAPVTVVYQTVNGSAMAGSDYTAVTGTVTFGSGATSATASVGVIGDTQDEPNEDFRVLLSSPVGANLGDAEALGIIQDDDEPLPVLSVSDVTLPEGTGNTTSFDFVVSLSAPSAQPVVVNYTIMDGTADGEDYSAAPSGQLTFSPGTTAVTLPVTVFGDDDPEPDEDFFLDASVVSGGATVGDGQGRGLILNDDGLYYTLSPCRVVDTRLSADGPALMANSARDFQTTGRCGIPADAVAVAIVVTTTLQTDSGNLRMFPTGGAPPPLASVINFQAGHTRASNGIIPLGAGGAIRVQCDMAPGSAGETHVLYDVYGYFK
jgi:uncharacterized protein